MRDAKKLDWIEASLCIVAIAGFIVSAAFFAAKPAYDVVKHIFK